RGNIPEAGHPEGKRIDQRLTQDDFLRAAARRTAVRSTGVPDAAVRTWEVQVIGRAGTQVIADLAAVDLRDLAGVADHGDHERAVEVLVAGLAQDSHPLKRRTQLRTRLVLLRRQPIGERAVGVAESEAFDELAVPEASGLEVFQRLRAR